MTFLDDKERMSRVNSWIIFGYVMSLITGTSASCDQLVSGLDSTKVATMCQDSVVMGTTVYIDTDLADTTLLSLSNIACTCYIDTQVGKQTEVISFYAGNRADCQSGTVFQFGDWAYTESNKCKKYEKDFPTDVYTNITVHLERESVLSDSRYCIKVDLIYCAPDKFQCRSGECVPKSSVCDSFPECSDGSDEQTCVSVSCLEGHVACDDNSQCIDPSRRCNGVYDCSDQSDESGKYCGETSVTVNQTLVPGKGLEPLIIVRCIHSPYLQKATTAAPSTTTVQATQQSTTIRSKMTATPQQTTTQQTTQQTITTTQQTTSAHQTVTTSQQTTTQQIATQQPITTTQRPTTQQPTTTRQQTTTQRPTSTSQQPTTQQLTTTTQTATQRQTTQQTTTKTHQPTPTTQLLTTTQQPTTTQHTTITQYTTPTTQHTITTTQQQPSTNQPTTTTISLQPATNQPTSTTSLQPTTNQPKSTTTSLQPATNQPTSTTSLQPTTNQPTSTTSLQPTTNQSTSTTTSLQPTTNQPTSTTTSLQPATNQPTSTTTSLQPTTNQPTSTTSLQPATNRPTSTTSLQPATNRPTSTTSLQPATNQPTSTTSLSLATTTEQTRTAPSTKHVTETIVPNSKLSTATTIATPKLTETTKRATTKSTLFVATVQSTTPYGAVCKIGEFRCLDGKLCIGQSFKCDQTIDCYDRSDEQNCAVLLPSEEAPMKEERQDRRTLLIIGLVVGTVAVLAIIGLVIFCVRTSQWYRNMVGETSRSHTFSEDTMEAKDEPHNNATHFWYPVESNYSNAGQHDAVNKHSSSVYIVDD